ncbi:hypothetical protein [Nonomuraea angiospora]
MADSRLLGALMLSVLAVLVGCGGGPPEAGEKLLGKTIDLDQVDYPLASFELTDAALETTLRARYLLTQQCADRFHVKLPARQSGRHRLPQNDRYGMYDVRTARTWAYSLDAPPLTAPLWQDQIDRKSRLFQIVSGVDEQGHPARIADLPQGGCLGAANRQLERGETASATGKARNPVPELESRAWKTSRKDPAVQSAAAEWKHCMTRRGHDYEDPVEAPYSYWTSQRMAAHPNPTKEQRKHGIPPTEAERRAALDDITCKNESGFVHSWLTADLAAQRQLIAENRSRLERHRQRLDNMLRNAAEVL